MHRLIKGLSFRVYGLFPLGLGLIVFKSSSLEVLKSSSLGFIRAASMVKIIIWFNKINGFQFVVWLIRVGFRV